MSLICKHGAVLQAWACLALVLTWARMHDAVLVYASGLASLRLVDAVNRYARRQRSGRTSMSRRSWCWVISFWNFPA